MISAVNPSSSLQDLNSHRHRPTGRSHLREIEEKKPTTNRHQLLAVGAFKCQMSDRYERPPPMRVEIYCNEYCIPFQFNFIIAASTNCLLLPRGQLKRIRLFPFTHTHSHSLHVTNSRFVMNQQYARWLKMGEPLQAVVEVSSECTTTLDDMQIEIEKEKHVGVVWRLNNLS